jgi:hypothetical protein
LVPPRGWGGGVDGAGNAMLTVAAARARWASNDTHQIGHDLHTIVGGLRPADVSPLRFGPGADLWPPAFSDEVDQKSA